MGMPQEFAFGYTLVVRTRKRVQNVES